MKMQQERGMYGIIGISPAMQRVYEDIKNLSHNPVNVHIYGETGTGKQLVARALHDQTAQQLSRNGGFVHINCAAIPSELVESELFGHVQGAYTTAYTPKTGYLKRADNGTLFLDEIARASPKLQDKILTALDYDGEGLRQFTPVGGVKSLSSNFRLITASSINLRDLAINEEFSRELFYRLATISIYLPPLRKRQKDLELLVNHFLQKHGDKTTSIEPSALGLIKEYPWPGNIRQLESVIKGAITYANGVICLENLQKRIRDTDLGPSIPQDPDTGEVIFIPPQFVDAVRKGSLSQVRDAAYEIAIRHRLNQNSGSVTDTAKDLGVNRTTLHKQRTKLQIE